MDSSSSGGDDRWKLSKKGRSRSGRPHAMDAFSSAGGSMLSRSYSASVSSSRSTTSSSTAAASATGTGSSSSSSSAGAGAGAAASSSSSQQQQAGPGQQAAESSSSSSRLSKKCVEAVKEHRARFYIVRRCVSMLVCWRDY